VLKKHSVNSLLFWGGSCYTLCVCLAYGYIAFYAVHQVENQVAKSRIAQVHQHLTSAMAQRQQLSPDQVLKKFDKSVLSFYPGLTITLSAQATQAKETTQSLTPQLQRLDLGTYTNIHLSSDIDPDKQSIDQHPNKKQATELYVHVAYLQSIRQRIYYLYNEDHISEVNQQESTFIMQLALVGLVIMLAGILLIILISKHIATPLKQLANALLPNDVALNDSSTSAVDKLVDLPGQTRNDEIGMLSRNLASLLARNQQFLLREQAFSRHCSHELRTPIAIIKNSVSLLKRPSCRPELRQRSITRIDTATIEMTCLVETFLMLGRGNEQVTSLDIDLKNVITNILTHLRQTLPVELTMQSLTVSGQAQLQTQPTICNVLLTNIIRNAFVHSHSCIEITFEQRSITVSNDVTHNSTSEAQGYGYGLEIMHRMAQRLCYDITINQTDSVYCVTVSFDHAGGGTSGHKID